jgi:hypothetical protein
MELNAINKKEDTHIECLSDFCGNYKSPGAWADLSQRPDGSRYIALGGDWIHYAPHAPEIIEGSDARFAGFVEACERNEDFTFVRENWI